jgi:hypothetical protein
MGASILVYEWAPNKSYLQKLLHRLEYINDRNHWLDGNYNWRGICPNPIVLGPGSDLTQKNISTVEVNGDGEYPAVKSFTWSGETVYVDQMKVFDYGRCKLYICEDHRQDGVFWLLFDSVSRDWYYCSSFRGTIDHFLDWINHLL